MLSRETLTTILGIDEHVDLTPAEMAKRIRITFYPHVGTQVSEHSKAFTVKLRAALTDLGVTIVDYQASLEKYPLSKTLKRFGWALVNNAFCALPSSMRPGDLGKHFFDRESLRQFLGRTRIKKGTSIIVVGRQEKRLPMEHIYSFKHNSVITILDVPQEIVESTSFMKHFDTAMGLFAHHMTNIVIGVTPSKWILYNFNASHPTYSTDADLKPILLKGLIPKIAAPVRPYRLSEFHIHKIRFDPLSKQYQAATTDLVDGARAFASTNLYPPGRKIDELPFRTAFHRFIGALHLDNRSGMSFGFLAKVLPMRLPQVYSYMGDTVKKQTITALVHKETIAPELAREIHLHLAGKEPNDFFIHDGKCFIAITVENRRFVVEVPAAEVLSQRSGSDKTHIHPSKDLLILGIDRGRMSIRLAKDAVLDGGYKPSFDTQVILAHAVGSGIMAGVVRAMKKLHAAGVGKGSTSNFDSIVEKQGIGLAHWHGYVNNSLVPRTVAVYGAANPHVSCSSPQSALYALAGKINALSNVIARDVPFVGDIHIEPHHGSNLSFTSQRELVKFLQSHPDMTELGNRYLDEPSSRLL